MNLGSGPMARASHSYSYLDVYKELGKPGNSKELIPALLSAQLGSGEGVHDVRQRLAASHSSLGTGLPPCPLSIPF